MNTEDTTPHRDTHEASDMKHNLLVTVIGWIFKISFVVIWCPCWLLYKLVYIAIPAGLVASAIATKMGHGKLVHDSILPFFLLTGLGLFLRFYIYAINLRPAEEILRDNSEEEEKRNQETKKDVKKLLEKKWFKWVSRSFTVIWLFLGCLGFYYSEGGIVRTGSQGYWITVVWGIGIVPMIFIVALIIYPSQGDSRGSSGSSKIGKQYEENEVTEENKAKAAKLFREAAEQGHVSSQFNLGVMYDTGVGVPEDKGEATKWIRKAAEQRHGVAIEWLEENAKGEKGE